MKKKPQQLSLLGTVLALLVVAASSVSALPPQASAHAQSTAGPQGATGLSQAASHRLQAGEGRGSGQSHLAAAKLKSCQNRQQAIDNIMARIADRGQKQLTLFSTIATRVETFYTDKGNTLANYDQLVADVNTHQAAAQSVVDTIKSDSTGFSCDSSDPKAFVESFKSSLKTEISVLKDYRTSVKNLIVGVKSVQGTSSSASQTNGGTQ